jgi:hypothetical protein
VVLCCISLPFGRLSTTRGKITYVLLTRAPLYRGLLPFSCDLHVLSAPLTFVLSQDQTLQLDLEELRQLSIAGKTAPCRRQALVCAVASLSHSPERARHRFVCHPISRRRRGGPTRHHISRRFRLSAASSRTIQFSRNEERNPSQVLRLRHFFPAFTLAESALRRTLVQAGSAS